MTELVENAESPKSRLPAFPTAPWKSRQPREISTFPQLRRRLSPIETETQQTRRSITYCGQKMVLTMGATLDRLIHDDQVKLDATRPEVLCDRKWAHHKAGLERLERCTSSGD